jgi:hypothetical protein
MSDTTVVPDTKEWKALQTHYESARALKLRDLFAADPSGGLALILPLKRTIEWSIKRYRDGIPLRRTESPRGAHFYLVAAWLILHTSAAPPS